MSEKDFDLLLDNALDNPDIYQAMYSIIHRIDEVVDLNAGRVKKLANLINRCKEEDKYKIVDLKIFLKSLVPKISNMVDYCTILQFFAFYKPSDIVLSENHTSYTIIYKTLKDYLMRDTMQKCDYKKLGVCIKLLDNPDLVYKNLYTTVHYINYCIDAKTIYENFVSCCLILKTVVRYDRRVFADKQTYLKSLLCFLIDNIDFVRETKAAKNICSTIKHIIKVLSPQTIKNLLFGKYKVLLEKLRVFILRKTQNQSQSLKLIRIYEEQLLLGNIFYIMHKIIVFLAANGAFIETPLSDIEKLHISEGSLCKRSEWIALQVFFCTNKYLLLDAIVANGCKVDTQSFLQDLYICANKHKVVAKLSNLIFYIDLNKFKLMCAQNLSNLAVFAYKVFCKKDMSQSESAFLTYLIISNKDPILLMISIYYFKKYNSSFCERKIGFIALTFKCSLYKPCLVKNTDLIIEYMCNQEKEVFTKFIEQVCCFDFLSTKMLELFYIASHISHNISILDYCDRYTKAINLHNLFYIALIRLEFRKAPEIYSYDSLLITLIMILEDKDCVDIEAFESAVLRIVFCLPNKKLNEFKDLYLFYTNVRDHSRIYDNFIAFKQKQNRKMQELLKK